ncbi:MAG: cache domain-containing protein, partial [Proteobacteria bacterium]|nr:cache domain-containing protein [Pseudomonadota bacterium]
MWKNKSGIQTEFLNKMIFIVFVFIGLWCAIWIHYEYSNFKSKSESLRSDHVQSQKIILKNEVSGVLKYINDMRIQSEQKLEFALKERVYEAHMIAMNIYRQNADSKDIPEIIKMIKDALRPIRFNSGHGYYFAVSMDGIEQLYPVRPQFEGENLMELQDSKGNFAIQDEIKVIKSKNEGFVKHYWTKPDKDPSISYPKISFVKYFEPLDWYFGAGEYLDEAKEQIQEEVLNRLINLRFGIDGYFFGSTYKGQSLFSNGKITMGSGNIWNLTDPNGVKIIQEQIKAVENPEGGFVYYSWHKLNTKVPSPKISFVQGIPEWEWTIGAGVYLDTIEETILGNKTALIIGLQKRILQSLLILAVLLCLVYFWSKRISNKITKEIETFSFSLKDATTSAIVINPDDLRFREFKDIAVITNKMLTSQKQAEYGLEKTKEQYRLLVENQTDMIVKFDREGLFQFVSPSYCNTFGKTRKELLGKTFMPLIHEADHDNVKKIIKSVFKPPYTAHLEARALTKDGPRWQAWLNTAILNKDNHVETIVAVGRDIDDQKKIEQALIKSEQQFRGLFNSISDLIYTQDLEGRFTSANPAMHRLFGYGMDELLGRTPAEFMEPELQSGFASRYLEMVKKKGYHEGIGCYFKQNQEKIYLEYQSFLVKPDGGEPYISGIGRDVTERVLSEQKVKQLQEQVVQSQKMESIGTLAGGIAHDFNN